ncbi:MAG: hypothetical protein N2Z85_00365 [Patescibacteria group bacterium]|nr:hypothetical protein [Patescibacteria group bacterium]
MPNELPYQTYQRLTGKSWPGGTSQEIVNLLKKYGITAQPGSAEANLALQSALLKEYSQPITQTITSTPTTQTTQQPNPIIPQTTENTNIQQQVTPREPRDILKPTESNISSLEKILKEQEDLLEESRKRQREEALALLETRLSLIDDELNRRKSEIEKEEEAEKARASAIALRSGLAGSPFGESYVKNVEELAKKEKDIAAKEAASKKAAIMADVNSALNNIEQRYREQMLGIKKQKADYFQGIRNKALDDFKTLAKAPNLTFAKIKENRDLMKALVDQTGYDEDTLEFIWASQPKNDNIDNFKSEIKDGKVIFTWFDKSKGDVNYKIIDVPEVKGKENELSVLNAGDGKIILYPKSGLTDKNQIEIIDVGIRKGSKEESSNTQIIQSGNDYYLVDKKTGEGQKIILNKQEETPTNYQEKLRNSVNKLFDRYYSISKNKDKITKQIITDFAISNKFNDVGSFEKSNPALVTAIKDLVNEFYSQREGGGIWGTIKNIFR